MELRAAAMDRPGRADLNGATTTNRSGATGAFEDRSPVIPPSLGMRVFVMAGVVDLAVESGVVLVV
ncbi:hypothetical protein, partial [Kitasatospora sp. NPDC127116]|uniref:hypothetical protein n=1 Tax=Kitasatospora sp. NPDC127116 TaxID=3345367 RepID=UPI003639BFF0